MPNKELKSWIEVSPDSDFSIHNIPFGVYSDHKIPHRVCSAIGDNIIDLGELAHHRFIVLDTSILEKSTLNDFIATGKLNTRRIRNRIIELLSSDVSELRDNKEIFSCVFKKRSDVNMLLPVRIGDYTDFYSSID